jgi:hypothetical protein
MMVTCAEAIRELFSSKDQILTTKEIIDAVSRKYPGVWKEVTIRTHTMGCSINHTSSKWYPSFPKFLYTVESGRVRLYDRESDGIFNIDTRIPRNDSSDEGISGEEEIIEFAFSFEKDLQEYLSRELQKLESGLILFTEEGLTGREISIDSGRIDILAKDAKNDLVIIELKVNQAPHSSLTQILSYMASIKKQFIGKKVRGIIIAENFDKRLKLAVTQVPNVTLMQYKVKFDFEKVGSDV